MSITVAAVDCGTNSIRLLIMRREGDSLTELVRETRLARLGQGVDATGRFHPDALRRTFAICDEYAALVAQHGASRVRFVATSAARDAANKNALFDGVRERLGVDVEVISGDEEARLSSSGVVSGVQADAPMLVIDIGGGSTELVVLDGTITHAVSLNMGAVRVRERFLTSDPPAEAEQESARAFIADLLDGSGTPFSEIRTAVGVAGTVTTLAAAELGLEEYSRRAVHGTVLSRESVQFHCRRWLGQPVAVTETEPTMHPLRASVIGAGSMILDEISARVPGGSILVSETDILDGIALEMLR